MADPTIVAQKSAPFLLCEATSAKRLADGTWQFDVPHQKDDQGADTLSLEPIKNRFVYVFRSTATKAAQFWLELSADGSGNLTVLQGTAAGGTDNRHLSLVYQVGDEQFFYQFFVTRFRLDSPGAIDKFDPALAARQELPRFFFGQWTATLPPDVLSGPVTEGPSSSLPDAIMPVVDALTIAAALHTAYRIACDGLMAWIDPPADLKIGTEEGRIRRKKLLIANLLRNLADANGPDNKLKLKGMFGGDGTGANVKSFIQNVKENVEHGIRFRDSRGATLCFWIDGALMKALKDAVDLTSDAKAASFVDTYAEFLNRRADYESRLAESAPGLLYLQNLVQNPDTEYKTFVLLETTAKEKFEVAEKAKSFVTSSWMQLIPAIIGRQPITITPTKLAQMLSNVTHVKIPAPITRTIKMPPTTPGGAVRSVTIEGVALTAETKQELGKWFAEEGDVAKGMKMVAAAFSMVTVAFAVSELGEAKTDADKIQAGVALTGNLAEGAAAGMEAFEVAATSAKFLGTFAAVISLLGTSAATGKALAFKDYGSAVGDGVQVFGSGLIALSATLGAFGAESGATVVGLPLGIVAAIGAALCLVGGVIVALFHDTDLQKMVKFSAFGSDPSGTNEKRPWSPVPFSQWNQGEKGLEKQIDAIFGLLGAFSVKPQEYTSVRIYPGLTGPASRFLLHFQGTFNPMPGLKRDTTAVYDCAAKTLTVTGGDPLTLKGATGEGTDGEGRPFISIDFEPQFTGEGDGMQVFHTSVDVQLALDEEKKIPESKPLHCDIYTLNSFPSGEVFSKDIE
jgi:hypothetical protein